MFCCFQYGIRHWQKQNILNDLWAAGVGIATTLRVWGPRNRVLFPFLQAFQIGSWAHLAFCLTYIMVGAISPGWSTRNVKLTIHPT